MKANWTTVEIAGDYMLIRDVGPWDSHSTITNDAEEVIRAVVATNLLGDRKLFYVDSDGRIDRLMIENGEFAGFKNEALPPRVPRDHFVDPTISVPRDDNAFWNAFRKRNPDWKGD